MAVFRALSADIARPVSVVIAPLRLLRSVVRFVTCDSAMLGMSAATSERNAGAAVLDVGPANTVLAPCVFKLNANAGVLVGLATLVVNRGDRLPELKFVTVPFPVPGKVWPEAKVMTPLLAIDRPVAAGAHEPPLQNIRFRVGGR